MAATLKAVPAPAAAPASPASPAAAEARTSTAPGEPGEAPAAPAQAKEEAKAEAIRMMRLKVDDMEAELPESEVLKIATLNAKSVLEARSAIAKLEELQKRLKEDPEGLMAEAGLDPDARAVDRLNRKLQAELDDLNLTAEGKELKALKAEKAEREKQEKARTESEEKTKSEAAQEKHREHFAGVIVEALKQTKLPHTSETAARLALLLRRNVEHGLGINPTLLAKEVESDLRQESKTWISEMEAETLADYIGPATLKRLVKLYAMRAGVTTLPKEAPPPAKKSREERNREERESLNNFFHRK